MPFFLAALAVAFGTWYWLVCLAGLDQEILTTPDQRIWAGILLWAIMLVGMLFWPRARRSVTRMDYLIPASYVYLGWLGLSLLNYHYRMLVLLVRREGQPIPLGTFEGQVLSAVGALAGLVYLIAYRAFPPPIDAAEPHTGWRRHIQYTLLDDIVGWIARAREEP